MRLEDAGRARPSGGADRHHDPLETTESIGPARTRLHDKVRTAAFLAVGHLGLENSLELLDGHAGTHHNPAALQPGRRRDHDHPVDAILAAGRQRAAVGGEGGGIERSGVDRHLARRLERRPGHVPPPQPAILPGGGEHREVVKFAGGQTFRPEVSMSENGHEQGCEQEKAPHDVPLQPLTEHVGKEIQALGMVPKEVIEQMDDE